MQVEHAQARPTLCPAARLSSSVLAGIRLFLNGRSAWAASELAGPTASSCFSVLFFFSFFFMDCKSSRSWLSSSLTAASCEGRLLVRLTRGCFENAATMPGHCSPFPKQPRLHHQPPQLHSHSCRDASYIDSFGSSRTGTLCRLDWQRVPWPAA